MGFASSISLKKMWRAIIWFSRSSPPTSATRTRQGRRNRRRELQLRAVLDLALTNLFQCQPRLNRLAVAQHRHSHRIANLVFFQNQIEIVRGFDFLAVDAGNDVAQSEASLAVPSRRLYAGLRCGAAARDIDNQHARHPESFGDLLVRNLNS